MISHGHEYNYLPSTLEFFWGFPGGSVVKNPPANAGDVGGGLILGLGGSLAEGNGDPLQYSYLGNPMDNEFCETL